MKYSVVWLQTALSDLSSCVLFVLKVSAEAAKQLKKDIEKAGNSLALFPDKNPVFEGPKSFPFVLRKQIVNNRYILLYTVEEQKVVIYRILDSRRKFGHLV